MHSPPPICQTRQQGPCECARPVEGASPELQITDGRLEGVRIRLRVDSASRASEPDVPPRSAAFVSHGTLHIQASATPARPASQPLYGLSSTMLPPAIRSVNVVVTPVSTHTSVKVAPLAAPSASTFTVVLPPAASHCTKSLGSEPLVKPTRMSAMFSTSPRAVLGEMAVRRRHHIVEVGAV